jgi:hypothetical protein
VRCGGGEAVFDVEGAIELRESIGLKMQELARAQELAHEHRELIVEKWHEHIG